MKSILVFGVAVLILAGCASQSDYQSSYAAYREFGFSFDYVPRPVHGLTEADVSSFNGTVRQGAPRSSSEPDLYQSLGK